MRSLAILSVAAMAVPGATGCIAFNDDCQTFISEPKEVIGYLAEEVFIDKPNARHAPNAIGQMAADAFLHSQDSSSSPAEVAVINGGGIRAEGICVTRNIVPAGALKRGVLHEILPFDNQVLTLDVTGRQLFGVVESSVSVLSREGEAIADPPGNFLDIAGGTMEVDCSKPGGPSCIIGSTCRVTKLTVGTRDVLASSLDAKYRLAITDFLVNLGAGVREYLRGLDSNPAANPASASKVDSDLAEDYMRAHYNFSVERGLRLDRQRTVLLNCAVPPKPAG